MLYKIFILTPLFLKNCQEFAGKNIYWASRGLKVTINNINNHASDECEC